MRWWWTLLLLWLPALAPALDLSNHLVDGQRSETIEVQIDGRSVGRLHVDQRHPDARLRLPAGGERQRYRLRGEAVMDDGRRYEIAGAGLIVRSAGMDKIGEASDAISAMAAYTDLLTALRSAAPELDLDDLTLTRDAPATEAALAAAERRLHTRLPAEYRRFVLNHGSFHLGPALEPSAELYPPGELRTLKEFVLVQARANDGDATQQKDIEHFIGKHFAPAQRDWVIGVWENDEPSLVRVGKSCAAGELPYAFPETQWEVLMGAGLEDNSFIGLVSYEDDIVGETQCMGFERELAYSLHDHLYELGRDALYLLSDQETAIGLERRDFDGEHVWFRLTESDD